MHGRGVRLLGGNQRVADFVIGDHTLFTLRNDGVFALCARDYGFDGLLKVCLRHLIAPQPHGAQCGFIHYVGKVSARRSHSCARYRLKVHVLAQMHLTAMHSQYVGAALEVGQFHLHTAVETTGAQQRLIQYFGAVGGREQYNALARIEAVHFTEQLI